MEDTIKIGINTVWHHIRDRADSALGLFQSPRQVGRFLCGHEYKKYFCSGLLSCNALVSVSIIHLFVISLFIPLVILQDINNFPGYEKIQNNFLTVLMIVGVFPVIFIYIFYYVLDVSQNIKDYSGSISMISIVLVAIIISALMTKKHLEQDLSFKKSTIKWVRRVRIYLLIPVCIAFLAHLQIIPLEIAFRNISALDEKVNF